MIAPQVDEARGVIERQAARLGAQLMVAGEHWLVSQEHGRLVYQDEHGLLDLPRPRRRSELLASASLIGAGRGVLVIGERVERGTFVAGDLIVEAGQDAARQAASAGVRRLRRKENR